VLGADSEFKFYVDTAFHTAGRPLISILRIGRSIGLDDIKRETIIMNRKFSAVFRIYIAGSSLALLTGCQITEKTLFMRPLAEPHQAIFLSATVRT